jgi:hypothetical protein
MTPMLWLGRKQQHGYQSCEAKLHFTLTQSVKANLIELLAG